jgi:hypothetical protein
MNNNISRKLKLIILILTILSSQNVISREQSCRKDDRLNTSFLKNIDYADAILTTPHLLLLAPIRENSMRSEKNKNENATFGKYVIIRNKENLAKLIGIVRKACITKVKSKEFKNLRI